MKRTFQQFKKGPPHQPIHHLSTCTVLRRHLAQKNCLISKLIIKLILAHYTCQKMCRNSLGFFAFIWLISQCKLKRNTKIGVELPSCCLLDVKKWFNSLFSGLVLYIVFYTRNIAFHAVGVVALLLAGVRQTRKNFILLPIERTLAHMIKD